MAGRRGRPVRTGVEFDALPCVECHTYFQYAVLYDVPTVPAGYGRAEG